MQKYAVVGKGGVGKTVIAAMLTRVLLESGGAGRVLVIDADPAQGLTHALGMRAEKTMGQVREAILAAARARADEELTEIADTLDYMVMEALAERENLALLAMGRSESRGCFCAVNGLLRDAIELLAGKFDTIVIDGEAGVEQINRQVMGELDYLIMVTDTSARGLETIALLKGIVEEKQLVQVAETGVVFNRVEGNQEGNQDLLTQAAAKMGVDVLGLVPQDAAVASYDLVGRSLLELPADSSALSAVRSIAETLPRHGRSAEVAASD
jgi:CO dehydrogenase maturation factor